MKSSDTVLSIRAREIANADLLQQHRNTDRLMAILMVVQWVSVVLMAVWFSPRTWSGLDSQVHFHVWSALTLGTLVAGLPLWLAWKRPGLVTTRHTMAVAQMLFSAMLIHFSGGRIETHFHIFASLAVLAFYQDWRLLMTASVVIATDHAIRGYVWPQSIYGILTSSPWRTIEHVVWVVLEDVFLLIASHQGLKRVHRTAIRGAELEQINQQFEQQLKAQTVSLAIANNELTGANAILTSTVSEMSALRKALDQHSLLSITDRAGTITDVNAGFCRISGYEPEELIDQNHRILNSAHHPRSFWIDVWKTIASGNVWRGEICNRAKDGSNYWVDSTIVPQMGEDGRPEKYVSLRFDITDRKKNEIELLQSNERNRLLATAVERSPGATVMTDLEGRVRFANSAARALDRLFHYELRHGCPAMIFLEDRISGETIREITQTVTEGKVFHANIELSIQLPGDGRTSQDDQEPTPTRWLSVTASPLTDEAGVIDGILLAKEDITDEIMAAQTLEDAVEMAESSSRAKSEFLANMSHEIRTPMTAILGYADLLESEDREYVNSSQTADAIQTIRSNANHLLTIINDILDMSKIEAGKMTVEHIDTQPAQVIQETVSLLRPRAIGKGLNIRIVYESVLPERIQSDPTRLRQILLNLVGNAIKFTEVGEIVLNASVDIERQKLVVQVRDTGMGMDPEQRDRISKFDAFSQADGSMARQFGGTGLGLRISSSLAKKLGGELTVESELGRGSSFTASVSTGDLSGIPMIDPECNSGEAVQEIAPQAKPSNANSRPLEGLSILLAEDGPDNQRLIAFHLKKAGAQVELADNGRMAMECVQADPDYFDLIFMDMQMPELDGYGATRRLRDWGYQRPIVALTAHAMDGDRQKCLDAGCNDYTTKPISRPILIELAERYGLRTHAPMVPSLAADGQQSRLGNSLPSVQTDY